MRQDALLEYAAHAGNYYGTPRAQAEEKTEQGLLLLDIEPMGAKQVKQSAPDAVLIFIMPPSREELERRLRSRGDTSEEQIKMRLERASWEMEQRSWYDYTVVNDETRGSAVAEEILTIIANLADSNTLLLYWRNEIMLYPPVADLLKKVDSRYLLRECGGAPRPSDRR